MADKIVPIQKNETVNYGDRLVENFWKPKSTTSFTQRGHKDAIISLLQNVQDGFVCVCSEKLDDKDIIKLLFDLSGKIRVYILVNDYSTGLDIINGKALIRYSGVKNIGSFVLVNPNSNAPKGICFGGQMTDESLQSTRFSFELRINETRELFRHFCYHFWENAKKENNGEDVTSKPIDIYYDADKFGGKDYVFGTLFDFVEKTERVNLSGQNIIYLGKETEVPTEIKPETSQDLGDNPQKELLPKEEFEAQKPVFKDDGVSVQIAYYWQNVPFYLPENAKEHKLYERWNNEKKKIDDKLSELLKEIEVLEKKENTLPKRLFFFFLGKKSKFESLKNQIEKLKEVDFPNITENIRNEKIVSINKIDSEIASHSRAIDKENKKAKLEDEIEKYQQEVKNKQLDLSQKEEELSQKKKEHSQKDSNWKTLKEELQTFSKKLSDKEGSHAALGKNLSEINHEIAEKSKKIDAISQKIDEISQKIDEISQKIDEISQKIDEISPKIKEEKVEDKKNKLSDEKNKLSDEKNKLTDEKSKLSDEKNKLSDEKNKLSDEKYKLSESLDAVKKESEKLQKEIEDYTKTIKELTSKEKTLKDEIKLLDTFIKRDEEDKNKIEKEINLLENTIKSKQTEIQKIDSQDEKEESSLTAFSSKKDKKQQNSNATKGFEIQKLPQLPQTGKLYSDKNNTSYLAIENWEEYDDGLSEAKRLNAKLCATK